MAYRNFSETDVCETAAASTPHKVEAAASLSPLEWSVVMLARRDSLSSIEPPGRVAMAIRSLFGDRRNPDLADPRLEALRRFVIVARHLRQRLPDREIARFIAAGFSRAQVRLLLEHSFHSIR